MRNQFNTARHGVVVVSVVVGLALVAGAVQLPEAKSKQAGGAATKARELDLRLMVFRLEHIAARDAQGMVMQLMAREPTLTVVVASERGNSLVVRGPQEAIEEIRGLIEVLDVPPVERRVAERTQTRVFALRKLQADKTVTEQLRVALSEEGRLAVDSVRNSVVVQDVPSALAEFERLVVELEQGQVAAAVSAEALRVRLVWLISGLERAERGPLPGDLNHVAAELAKIGVAGLQLAAQTVVHTAANDQFEVQCTPELESRFNLNVEGAFVATKGATAGLQIRVTVNEEQSGALRQWCNLSTKIIAPPGQTIVLGSAPVGKMTSVFVLQVTDAANP